MGAINLDQVSNLCSERSGAERSGQASYALPVARIESLSVGTSRPEGILIRQEGEFRFLHGRLDLQALVSLSK
jgi:hypothetical protein